MSETDADAARVRAEFLQAMSCLAAGVTIVATNGEGGLAGQTVSAFTSITADPPSVLICLNLDSSGCEPVTRNRYFSVCFLGRQHADLSNAFAGRTEVESERRFEVGEWRAGATGCPILVDALAAIECKVTAHHDVATHRVFFGEVVAAHTGSGDPLIYARRSYAVPEPI